jgi:hypothetical protein
METVRIYPLATLRKGYARCLREARLEAARVWTLCRDLHLAARKDHTHRLIIQRLLEEEATTATRLAASLTEIEVRMPRVSTGG